MSYTNGVQVFSGENKRVDQSHGGSGSPQCLNGKHGFSAPQGTGGRKFSDGEVPASSSNATAQLDFVPENRAADCGDSLGSETTEGGVAGSCLRQQAGMTLEDVYGQANFDDDEDDSDWEPAAAIETVVSVKKWFCVNCTMGNFEEDLHCNGCGEFKESEIQVHGFPSSLLTDLHSKIRESPGDEATLGDHTVIGFDERMLLHSEVEMKSHPHPERPDRLRAIMANLATSGIFPGRCFLLPAREITHEELRMVHSMEHIEIVELTSSMLFSYFTPDTYANEHSAHAARLAAGLCADLATSILSGRAKNGFALVRPPGHHAGIKHPMGFCLHNNAAVGVLAAQSAGAKKVLIVDWDVHHGNGTQEIFYGNKSVLYISLHRHDHGMFYPGTGAAHEVGILGAEGYSVNIPWKCGGVGDSDYMFAFQHIVLPIALEFDPDLTIISAGFDAARGDPLGGCNVTPTGFAQMTRMLTCLSQGKLLVILEGGYNLHSISASAVAVIKVLIGGNSSYDINSAVPSKAGLQTVLEVLQIQQKFWPALESSHTQLLSQWKSLALETRKRRTKNRKRVFIPIWWKWGRKRLMYHLLNGGLDRFRKGKLHRKKYFHLNLP